MIYLNTSTLEAEVSTSKGLVKIQFVCSGVSNEHRYSCTEMGYFFGRNADKCTIMGNKCTRITNNCTFMYRNR